MRFQTWGGALILGGLVLAGLVLHADQSPAQPAATVAAPTPAPVPDRWAGPRWDTTNLTVISLVAFLGCLPWLAVAGVALRARHRSRLLEPDAPPLRDRVAVQLAYAERTARASTWPLQSLSYTHRVQGVEPVVAPALPPSGPLPGLEELLRAPGIVYGYGSGGPIIDRRATSVGIGGMPGSGKTSTAALLLAQHALRGGRVLLGDPHAGSEESLTSRVAPLIGVLPADQVAETPREILALAQAAHAELEHRQRSWRLIPPADVKRVVLAIDEWTSLLRGEHAAKLLDLLEDIAQQGRKYGVAVLLIAQSWSASAVGSSQLRNPLPAAVLHRMRPDEARMLSGLRGEAVPDDTLALPPGEAYVVGVDDGIVRARVPALGAPHAVPMPSRAVPEPSEPGVTAPRSTAGALADDNRTAQILQLAARGAEIREIVQIVYGIEKTGRAYTAAAREVWAAVAGRIDG